MSGRPGGVCERVEVEWKRFLETLLETFGFAHTRCWVWWPGKGMCVPAACAPAAPVRRASLAVREPVAGLCVRARVVADVSRTGGMVGVWACSGCRVRCVRRVRRFRRVCGQELRLVQLRSLHERTGQKLLAVHIRMHPRVCLAPVWLSPAARCRVLNSLSSAR